MPVKGGYLLISGAGGVLLWSGLRGKKWSDVIRSVIAGKNPKVVTTAYTIAGGTVVGDSFAGGSTSEIASDALKYQGAGYVWGGAPGSGEGNWDCSSFANAVIGRDLNLPIPTFAPGTYHGQSHGPTTLVWLVWNGCGTVPRSAAMAGDLAVWQTHMGIIIDNGQHMISALNSRLGTQVTTIDGGAPPGEILRVRRLK